jgi:hypothetical protein
MNLGVAHTLGHALQKGDSKVKEEVLTGHNMIGIFEEILFFPWLFAKLARCSASNNKRAKDAVKDILPDDDTSANVPAPSAFGTWGSYTNNAFCIFLLCRKSRKTPTPTAMLPPSIVTFEVHIHSYPFPTLIVLSSP